MERGKKTDLKGLSSPRVPPSFIARAYNLPLFFVLTVDILFILKIHMGSGVWLLIIALKAVRSKLPFYGGVET